MLFNLPKTGRRAFTLVELIIVIVIVGILAAISIVGYQSVVDRAEQAAAETTLQSVDREYRALAAFDMAVDSAAGVSIADMTPITGIDYTAGDTDSDGLLEPGETVTFDGVVLTLATATTTGDLSTSAADDGSSESADPYAGWDTAFDRRHNVPVRYLAERTGIQSFSVSVVYIGMGDPGSTLSGHIGNSNDLTDYNQIAFADYYSGNVADLPQIFVNEHGDTQWSYANTDADFLWRDNDPYEPEALGEHRLMFGLQAGWDFRHFFLDTTIIIPAWNG